MKKAIIVGATSGIGRELAKLYANSGWLVGATGRRQDLLYSLQLEYPNNIITECFDVTSSTSISHIKLLIEKLNGLDLLIYNSGYGDVSEVLDIKLDRTTVDTNVNGFIEIVNFTFNYFHHQGYGQLATTSSLASIRGNSYAPAYSASKAFQSIYLEGLHMRSKKLEAEIYITDIQPGHVDTNMSKGNARFWVSPPEKAAKQIYQAIDKRKWRVYITQRWWLVAQALKWMPDFIYHRLG
ncbi:MAG: SDR family NAD(P)-dependent oxidoreductase [Bacteroidetes bacterium]|nr:SDR family NAD(P)-dependent oxidoreductase [Bacteroidota bacterium]